MSSQGGRFFRDCAPSLLSFDAQEMMLFWLILAGMLWEKGGKTDVNSLEIKG